MNSKSLLFALLLSCALCLKTDRGVDANDKAFPYNEALSRRMAIYSFAAYEDKIAEILSWKCACCKKLSSGVGKPRIINNTHANLFGYVVEDSDIGATVVSFRGTVGASLRNWIEDLHFSKTTPYKGSPTVRVHKGFYEAYFLLRTQIHQLVNSKPLVIVTGHSLGAALAQLCALDLRESFPGMQVSTVSFGTPRTGNQAFSDYFSAVLAGNMMRVVHWKDIVTGVPPTELGFWHSPHEAFYSQTFTLISTCDGAEGKNCSDSVLSDSVLDHLMYYNMSNHHCDSTSGVQ